jgi:hypothetical protein
VTTDLDVNELFARELQEQLDDPDLAGEFFATDEFPKDDIAALRQWVVDQISEAMPESRAVSRFLRANLKTADVVAYLRDWNT